MQIRTRQSDGMTHVDLMLSHPMESGNRTDGAGQSIPSWYLTRVRLEHLGVTVAEIELSSLVSRNPVISLSMLGGDVGDELVFHWEDNRQKSGQRSTQIH